MACLCTKTLEGFLGLKSGTWCSVGRFRNKHFNYLGVLHFSLRGYWTEFQCISQSIIIHLSLLILNWSLIWPRLPRLALKSVHIHLKHSILVHSTDTMFRVQDTPNHGNMKKCQHGSRNVCITSWRFRTWWKAIIWFLLSGLKVTFFNNGGKSCMPLAVFIHRIHFVCFCTFKMKPRNRKCRCHK